MSFIPPTSSSNRAQPIGDPLQEVLEVQKKKYFDIQNDTKATKEEKDKASAALKTLEESQKIVWAASNFAMSNVSTNFRWA